MWIKEKLTQIIERNKKLLENLNEYTEEPTHLMFEELIDCYEGLVQELEQVNKCID